MNRVANGAQRMLREIYAKRGLVFRRTPGNPGEEVVRRRARFLLEEAFEFLEACFPSDPLWLRVVERCRDRLREVLEVADASSPDIVKIARESADVKYVLEGTDLEYGIDGAAVFACVHDANMKKNGGTDAKGKWLKQPGWEPPDISGELREQGWDE